MPLQVLRVALAQDLPDSVRGAKERQRAGELSALLGRDPALRPTIAGSPLPQAVLRIALEQAIDDGEAGFEMGEGAVGITQGARQLRGAEVRGAQLVLRIGVLGIDGGSTQVELERAFVELLGQREIPRVLRDPPEPPVKDADREEVTRALLVDGDQRFAEREGPTVRCPCAFVGGDVPFEVPSFSKLWASPYFVSGPSGASTRARSRKATAARPRVSAASSLDDRPGPRDRLLTLRGRWRQLTTYAIEKRGFAVVVVVWKLRLRGHDARRAHRGRCAVAQRQNIRAKPADSLDDIPRAGDPFLPNHRRPLRARRTKISCKLLLRGAWIQHLERVGNARGICPGIFACASRITAMECALVAIRPEGIALSASGLVCRPALGLRHASREKRGFVVAIRHAGAGLGGRGPGVGLRGRRAAAGRKWRKNHEDNRWTERAIHRGRRFLVGCFSEAGQ